MSSQNTFLVVIPTFNEIGSLGKILDLIQSSIKNSHVLVVDDGSTDGTLEFCQTRVKQDETFSLLSRDSKMGLGSAYRAGFALGLKRDFELIAQMDADGSHQVSDLCKMLQIISTDSKIDLIIGSRWISGGSVENWPFTRKVLSISANVFSSLLLSYRIKDSTSGLRIYRNKLLKRIHFEKTQSQGFGFQIEMSYLASKSSANIFECPIIFLERLDGVSKMTLGIILEAFKRVCLIRLGSGKYLLKERWDA